MDKELKTLYETRKQLDEKMKSLDLEIVQKTRQILQSTRSRLSVELADFRVSPTSEKAQLLMSEFMQLKAIRAEFCTMSEFESEELEDSIETSDEKVGIMLEKLFDILSKYYVERGGVDGLRELLRERGVQSKVEYEKKKEALKQAIATGVVMFKGQYVLGGYDQILLKLIEIYAKKDFADKPQGQTAIYRSPDFKDALLSIAVGEFGDAIQFLYAGEKFEHECFIYTQLAGYHDDIYRKQELGLQME